MSTKAKAGLYDMNRWRTSCNDKSLLLRFDHMAENISKEKKIDIDRARIRAYRQLQRKGWIT